MSEINIQEKGKLCGAENYRQGYDFSSKTDTEFCEDIGISRRTYYRKIKEGLTRQEIIDEKLGVSKDPYDLSWNELPVCHFCKRIGIARKTYYRYLKQGLTRRQMYFYGGKRHKIAENIIQNILREYTYFYDGLWVEREKCPKEIKHLDKNNKYRFDFVIHIKGKTCIIEEDDEGHFVGKGRKNDDEKTSLCHALYIPILRIKYDELENTEKVKDKIFAFLHSVQNGIAKNDIISTNNERSAI